MEDHCAHYSIKKCFFEIIILLPMSRVHIEETQNDNIFMTVSHMLVLCAWEYIYADAYNLEVNA